MCKNSKIISHSKFGQLSRCNACKNYSLAFNNILLQFDEKQLKKFKKYINNIDVEYWLTFYSCTTKKRKIPIPTAETNLLLFFTEEEFNDLKSLVSNKRKSKSTLLARDINYPLILN